MIERGTALHKAVIPIIVILLLASLSFGSVSQQTQNVTIGNPSRSYDTSLQIQMENLTCFLSPADQNPLSLNKEPYQEKSYSDHRDGTVFIHNQSIAETTSPTKGLMNSSWPMYCHDLHHTGLSLYSTLENPGVEIWRYLLNGSSYHCAPVIDNNGVLYVGRDTFYAIYPNGTLKWKHDIGHMIETAPVIDENGIIYFGTQLGSEGDNFYALYTNNGTVKWRFRSSNHITSSPAIGNDGTIYFGDWNGNFYALDYNGTDKWKIHTENVITSSPAIGEDGTIYYGSMSDSYEGFVYAVYPNGTIRWRIQPGSWVHGSPTIGPNGIIYIGSDDGYLYALYPHNGTTKWKCQVGSIWASSALDENGILYVGVWNQYFYAINENGTIKWRYSAPGRIWFGMSCAISSDGTIFFGTTWMDGGSGSFIALNNDGSERWTMNFGLMETSPVIGQDGTIYACSSHGEINEYGYLHAIGRGNLLVEANGPYDGFLNTNIQFTGTVYGGILPYSYHWDFGDEQTSNEQNPTHNYTSIGNYTARFTVTDNMGNISNDTAQVNVANAPPSIPTINGPHSGKAKQNYNYTLVSTDPEGNNISYYVDWDDETNTGWIGPFNSGHELTLNHTWNKRGTYTIKAKAMDNYSAESGWGTLSVTMPLSYEPPRFQFLYWLLERFPHAFPIFRYLLGFNQ
jgi:outer membrane protein assembly factor BamB